MDVCFSFIALKLAFRSITCPPVSHAFGPTFPAWLWHSPDVPTLPEPAPSSTSVMGFLHFPQNTSKHMLFLLMDWLVSGNWGWKNSHSHEWMKKLPNRPIMISCCFLTAASHFKILFWLVHCVPPPKKINSWVEILWIDRDPPDKGGCPMDQRFQLAFHLQSNPSPICDTIKKIFNEMSSDFSMV